MMGLIMSLPIWKDKYIGYESYNNYRGDTVKSFRFQNYVGYFPKKAIGGELSIPIGQLNIKVDATVSDAFHMLGDINNEQIINAIVKYNDGFNSIPVYEYFAAVGIDADFSTWFYNFYLMSLGHFKNPSMSSFWDVYERYESEPDLMSAPVFPTLNIGRYFNTDKKGAYGVALGWLTGSLGVFFYMSNQITESFSWGASLDAGFNFSDLSMLNQNSDDNDGSYVQYKFVEPKLTVGLGYKL